MGLCRRAQGLSRVWDSLALSASCWRNPKLQFGASKTPDPRSKIQDPDPRSLFFSRKATHSGRGLVRRWIGRREIKILRKSVDSRVLWWSVMRLLRGEQVSRENSVSQGAESEAFCFFFWPHHTAGRILVSWAGIKPVPPAVEALQYSGVLTTGLPGNIQDFFFFLKRLSR